MNHYLILHEAGHLRLITVYRDQDAALRAFHAMERACPPFTTDDKRCVMLSSDSLKSCMTTHGSWFDHDLGFPTFETGSEDT